LRKLVALFLVALVLASAPLALSIQFPRQVDPATAPADPVYGEGLYLFYGTVVAAISGGNFSAASALLRETPFIHIPPEISNAVDTFDSLVNSTAGLFDTVNAELVNASYFIATGRVALAEGNLTAAVADLRSANQTLTQLFGAEPQLASLTGIPSSLLLQKLHPLEALYVSDSAQADRLLRDVTGLAKLEATEVTLSVSPAGIVAGSDVSVSGDLTGPSGAPLPSRNVTVFFEGASIGTALTNPSGAYSARLATPFYYRQNATMFASFLPAGNDSLVYAPSTSAEVNLTVSFVVPKISFASPRAAYAGQPMGVNGTLTLDGSPLAGYGVSLSGFSTGPFAPSETDSALTAADGSFSLSLTPSSGLGGGSYTVYLATSSNRTVGPLEVPVPVLLVKESPDVTSHAPAFALAGLPLTISGSATVNGSAVSGAQVLNTSPAPPVDTSTSSGGSFSFTVTPPLTTPIGGWTYSVEVYPSQSWISAAPVSVTVFVFNPLVLVFPAGSLGMLGLVVRRRRPPALAQSMAPLEEAKPVPEGEKPRPTAGLPGIYFAAVELAERSTGVAHLPQATVREYLAAVQGRLKGFECFRSISLALERDLYSGSKVPGAEAEADAQLRALRREIEA
jgi:hypothetical protein